MKEFRYTILVYEDTFILEAQVVTRLKKGFKLYGSPFIDKEGYTRQAMTKGV